MKLSVATTALALALTVFGAALPPTTEQNAALEIVTDATPEVISIVADAVNKSLSLAANTDEGEVAAKAIVIAADTIGEGAHLANEEAGKFNVSLPLPDLDVSSEALSIATGVVAESVALANDEAHKHESPFDTAKDVTTKSLAIISGAVGKAMDMIKSTSKLQKRRASIDISFTKFDEWQCDGHHEKHKLESGHCKTFDYPFTSFIVQPRNSLFNKMGYHNDYTTPECGIVIFKERKCAGHAESMGSFVSLEPNCVGLNFSVGCGTPVLQRFVGEPLNWPG